MNAALRIVALTCCLCAGAAHGQSTVAIYGLLDTGVTYTNRVLPAGATQPGRQISVHPGAMQASRLGFRGSEDLGNGVKAVFTLEGGVNPDVGTYAQGGIPFGRRAVVGFESQTYGTLLLGRQTDFLDDMGTLSSTVDFGAQVATMHSLDRTYADRTNNSVRYNSPRAAGVRGVLMVGLGENAGSIREGLARSLGVDYERDNLRLAAGYYDSKLGATAANFAQSSIGALAGVPGDTALRTFTVGGAYIIQDFVRIHGTYSDVRQPLAVAGAARSLRSASNDRTQVFDLAVSVEAIKGTFFNASVLYDKVFFVGAEPGRLRQFNLGLDHNLSRRTDVYANAGYQAASQMVTPGMGEVGAPGRDRSQTLLRVGIRHRF